MNYTYILFAFFLLVNFACDSDTKTPKKEEQTCDFEVQKSPKPLKLRIDKFEDLLDIGDDYLYIYTFWSMDCKACVARMPCYEKLYQELKGEHKIKLVYVNLDPPNALASKVMPFVQKQGFSGRVLSPDIARAEMLFKFIDEDWSGKLPATLFVDNSADTWMFYEKSFGYDELKAVVQPLLTFKGLMGSD